MYDKQMIKQAEMLLQDYPLSCLTCKHFNWARFNDDARYKADSIKGKARFEFRCDHEPPMREPVIVTDYNDMEFDSDGYNSCPWKPAHRPRTVAYLGWDRNLTMSQDMFCRLAERLPECDSYELRRYRVVTEFLEDTDLGEEVFARFSDLSIDPTEARKDE